MSFTHSLSTNNYGPSKFVVSASAANGTHTTITSALAAASSGDTILIRDGSYTENLTLIAGVNLSAFSGASDTPDVTITGKLSFSSAGTVTISNIRLTTNSDNILSITGSAASIVNLTDCYLNCSNNTGISFTTASTSAAINLYRCNGNLGTTGIAFHSMSSTGSLAYNYCFFTNTGGSSTVTSNSAGTVAYYYVVIASPLGTTSTGGILLLYSNINTVAQNALALTANGTGPSSVFFSNINAGTNSAITVGTGAALNSYNNVITSSNSNASTGVGQLLYGGLDFTSSATINTSTQTPIAYSVAQGGTGLTTIGNSKVLASNSSGTLAARAFSVVRQIFTSTGTYTPTSGMLFCDVIVIGSGGAGGGCPITGASQVSCGGGAGAGEYAQGIFSAASVGASKAVTINASGTVNSGATGGNGGTNSLGVLITAGGGSGGVAGTAGAVSAGSGGAGGTGGSGGDFRAQGNTGMSSFNNFASTFIYAGQGGSSQFGSGGLNHLAVASGTAAVGYGSGGSGANNGQNTAAKSGGAGTNGIVIVTEYVIA